MPGQSRWRDGDEPVGGGDTGNTEIKAKAAMKEEGKERERLFP